MIKNVITIVRRIARHTDIIRTEEDLNRFDISLFQGTVNTMIERLLKIRRWIQP